MEEVKKGSSLWSSKPEEWDKFPEFTPEELARLNSPEFHGCNTGDCPHDKQTECDAELVKVYKEYADTLSLENRRLKKEVEMWKENAKYWCEKLYPTDTRIFSAVDAEISEAVGAVT